MKTLSNNFETTDGIVRLTEDCQIEGHIEARIESNAKVIVGPTALVTGDIQARTVEIHGKVEGCVTAGITCELRSTAVVSGAVSANHMKVEEGADFEGAGKIGSCPLDFLLDEVSERLEKNSPASGALDWVS